MPLALIAESVSKCFKIQRSRPSTLKDWFIQNITGHRSGKETLWALYDVSFSLEKGRVLGLIGHNGAGKSTLLRLLCGVGLPTSGRIRRNGYVSGLLELGSGLHPDMTGRENIMTAGILNGLTRKQVLAHRDEIIGFSELEAFIDQPVRTYSNGMFLRLAFSTAIHFDPDILMIDEVLAVGDSRFQQKCFDRLEAFRKAGKTLVLVSHESDKIRSMCHEVLVLEEGRVVIHSKPEVAITCYNDLMRKRSERRAEQVSKMKGGPNLAVERGSRLGTQEAAISAVYMYNAKNDATDSILSGDSLRIVLEYTCAAPLADMALILGIYNEANVKCFESTIPSITSAFGPPNTKERLDCYLPRLPLFPGRYYVNVGLYPVDWDYVYDYHWQMHILQVVSSEVIPSGVSGIVSVRPTWSASAGD